MRNKITACSVLMLFIAAASTASAEVDVCGLLQETPAPSGPTAPNPVATPDISELIIQVRTTRPLKEQVAGVSLPLEHKCAIASDLAEVDVMMKDVGFAGYGPPETAPLFENAHIKHIADSVQADLLRDLVYAILSPEGDVDQAMSKVQSNPDLYDPTIMNVYFVHYEESSQSDDDVPFEVKGMHIRDEEGNSEKMIFYGDSATPSTLAHEFAHSFSAGHVNFQDRDGKEWCVKHLPYNITSELTQPQIESIDMVCEFSMKNYMWAGSPEDRQFLGIPQKERMMHNVHSVISQFSPSLAPIRCPDFSSDLNKGCSRLVGP